MKSLESKDQKRRYEKPTFRIIELMAEEVLGLGCSSASATISVPKCFPPDITDCKSP